MLGMMLCTGCRSGENGEIYVYSYGDYFDQEAIADFEDETGIRVIQIPTIPQRKCIRSSRREPWITTHHHFRLHD